MASFIIERLRRMSPQAIIQTVTHTPVALPYFAPTSPMVPSYERIVAQPKDKLSLDKEGRKVVIIDKLFVVKYGKNVDLVEGENMLFVQQHTTLRIPTLYAMYHHASSGDNVIIMEYVEGESLVGRYNDLDHELKMTIGVQLRAHLKELRSIPSPAYFGLPGRRPYREQPWIFKAPAGPFTSADAFLDAYFAAQFPTEETDESCRLMIADLKGGLKALTRTHHRSVFTHADLQPQNVLLRPDGTICLIDWESASFCPEYFEFFIAGTHDMASYGLRPDSDEDVMQFATIVVFIILVWTKYTQLQSKMESK
ncbi:protein kinase-like domain-containing protein [Xylariomycetidae sp. FL2044]|nr:protein kinase-like domain-containing protein [Xylariomycetidae sp. FL2044]